MSASGERPANARTTRGRRASGRTTGERPVGERGMGEHPASIAAEGGRTAGAAVTGERPASPRSQGAGRTKRRTSGSGGFSALTESGLTERQRRIMIGVITGVAVLVAATVLTVLIGRVAALSDAPQAAAADGLAGDLARPDDYQAWPSLKQFLPIAERKADTGALTVQEVFGEKALKNGKLTLKLTDRRADADCAAALWGQELISKLADAGCTQVVRGIYLSADGRYVAQYTLFDLADVKAADGFVQVLTTLHRGGWVRPLDSRTAVFPLGGYSESSGHAMGHFAGLVWIGRVDGADPGAKDDYVKLSLTVRGVEKSVFRRVVAAGPPPASVSQ